MTASQVKMMLQVRAAEMSVTVVGLHSIVLLGDGICDAIFDIAPDESASGMHWQFPLPFDVSFDEVNEFGRWLAEPGYAGETVH